MVIPFFVFRQTLVYMGHLDPFHIWMLVYAVPAFVIHSVSYEAGVRVEGWTNLVREKPEIMACV